MYDHVQVAQNLRPPQQVALQPARSASWLSKAGNAIAIGTDDVYKTAEAVRHFGGKIGREPGPIPGINTKITAVFDPDGWKSVFVAVFADFLRELE
ncbi:hypothetical protein R1flu_026045 [Riccia fluitans]|uniref:VOC domain-containing protein n=1 Tax=Riccia fluitans TaxID=41844 RepID=A0ABD1XEV4_9MARC